MNGWIVIQQRIDNSTSFNQSWSVYKNGFGTYNRNYWMGLERMYQLAKGVPYRLRIEFLAVNNNTWFSAEYDTFLLSSEALAYQINVTGYSGDAPDDPMNLQASSGKSTNGMKFTTHDNDNDLNAANCASAIFSWSGWWYYRCSGFALNTPYDATGKFRICGSGCTIMFCSTTRMMIKQS